MSGSLKKILVSVTALLLAAAAAAVSVLAFFWLSYDPEGTQPYGTFSAEVLYSFSEDMDDAENLVYTDGILSAEIADVSKDNHYTNLRVWVRVKGYGTAYVRAGLSLSWFNSYSDPGGNEYEVIYRMPYETLIYESALWIDDRKGDQNAIGSGYLYLAMGGDTAAEVDIASPGTELPEGVTAGVDESGLPTLTVQVISGITPPDNQTLFSGMRLKILTSVQAVQTNRYKQFWQIDSLPQRTSP